MKIVSGNSNISLAKEIASYLNVQLLKATIKKFPDKEVFVEIQENVRGEDVFVIQSTSFPANDHLMELLVTIDALKRGSAKSHSIYFSSFYFLSFLGIYFRKYFI